MGKFAPQYWGQLELTLGKELREKEGDIMQTREEELNYSLSEFLNLILPDENRVVYIDDLITNFLLLDANAKN